MSPEVRWFVCAIGEDAYRIGRDELPCDSRWVRPSDAARMLGVTPVRMRRHVRSGGVPVNFQGWVSLEWVEAILRFRRP